MRPEKTQLTQDGQPQFQTRRVEKAFIALNHIMLEDEAALREATERKQFTVTLRDCLLDTATQLQNQQQKNTALQIRKIDITTH